ncbi:predicted protein [Aspergillus nidulans FGSC A4]|uniref:Uncharacterized protein n=1 Tax=Emericella nidulans (strain FGSC A4 / ATCC 38163 / CBS 112.46 / NRRL 194 / M139) TaxID=227321 RepID=Q5BBC4_EMENI|nr:hypothetical protein [Aspergillus nidulans FGSC A4]EAA64200.1 predicted protein [Aspergillus nidulans FGSC A4]CBF86284.1 TPA: hypothetical protein ANIA_02156 [Aspergillus nidulans FGSC A4]|eukprot:XP_659760.1 predicted protein [Aspergillus nidulans FGSC A4]
MKKCTWLLLDPAQERQCYIPTSYRRTLRNNVGSHRKAPQYDHMSTMGPPQTALLASIGKVDSEAFQFGEATSQTSFRKTVRLSMLGVHIGRAGLPRGITHAFICKQLASTTHYAQISDGLNSYSILIENLTMQAPFPTNELSGIEIHIPILYNILRHVERRLKC